VNRTAKPPAGASLHFSTLAGVTTRIANTVSFGSLAAFGPSV
jgi:hypothetical protein